MYEAKMSAARGESAHALETERGGPSANATRPRMVIGKSRGERSRGEGETDGPRRKFPGPGETGLRVDAQNAFGGDPKEG